LIVRPYGLYDASQSLAASTQDLLLNPDELLMLRLHMQSAHAKCCDAPDERLPDMLSVRTGLAARWPYLMTAVSAR
jgi:hypothetical protein